MNWLLRAMLLLLVVSTCCIPALPASAENKENPSLPSQATLPSTDPSDGQYTIGPGDVLNIAVWQNADLTQTVGVLPDGTISFPLIGSITAAGKTVSAIKQEVTEKLAPFVTEPVVSVWVNSVQSMIIYVIGKVNRPGHYGLNANITVLQALAMAGGLNTFAEEDSIKVFRKEGGNTSIFGFNYSDVSAGKKLEQNITLKRGDVIVVP